MSKVIKKLLAVTLSFAMVMTGFTFLGGAVTASADSGDKPENVIMGRYDDVEEFQEASGGTFKWIAINADYSLYDPLIDMVDANDFQLQTKTVMESEWRDVQGTLTVSPYSDSGDEDIVTITAEIPDNTGDVDISWRVIYKHSEISLQIEEGQPIHITQMKPETSPAVKPAIVYMSRGDGIEEFQEASGGRFEWTAQNADYEMLSGDEPCKPMFELVDESDFQLQKQLVTENDWTDVDGQLTLDKYVEDGEEVDEIITITAAIPDNNSDSDISWRVIYKHCAVELQGETCVGGTFHITQMKPEAQPTELPAIENIVIDEGADSGANQPASDGKYAWFFAGGMDSDFSEITSEAFSMEVKVGDGEWTASEVAAVFEPGDNYDEGFVTAEVPDNIEEVTKQWRFVYAGDSVECPAITQAAYEAPVAGWNEDSFTYSEDNTTITGLTDEGKALVAEMPEMVLPSSHNDVDITAIGNNAFANVKMTGVQFPATLKSIGNAAFNGCTELRSITLPASLESIGMQAFNNSTKVESITFEEGIKITSIPQAAFQKVTIGTAIPTIVIPEGVTSIGANAFGGSLVENLSLPSTLVTIDQRGFMNNKLSSLVIPDSVKTIGNMGFSQQHARAKDTLTSLDLGSGVESIGKQAFEGVKLASADVPESLKTLDADAFKNNSGGPDADKRVILNVTKEEQFNGEGDYSGFVATGSGHRCSFNGVTNYVISFDTIGRSNKNDAYTKDGKITEADLAAARSNQAYDVFDGWFTSAEGGEIVDADKVYEADTVLFAHWSENTALKDAEEAIAALTPLVEAAQTAADKAAESGTDEDKQAASEALSTAIEAAKTAGEKMAVAQEFADTHSLSAKGVSNTNTAVKNLAKANATVTKLDAAAAAETAEEAAAAAAAAAPGTQDAVDKAAAAKAAADEALVKAEAAMAAAEAAYGADSAEANAAADAVKDAKAAAKKAAEVKTNADKAKAAADAKAADEKAKKVKTVTVNVKTVTAAVIDKAVKKAGGSEKYVTKIVLGSKVKKIKAGAFKKYKKVTTLEVKTKKLKKKAVKKALKGSKVKTVKVKVAKKAATNKKYVKKYKKIFTKKNAGKKVSVKK